MSEEKKPTLEEIQKKIEECEKLKHEYLAGWQRERADFLNYKKEEMGRVGEILKYADVGLISKFLPILDNFDITEKKLPENLKADENIRGILQIKEQVLDFLKNLGIEPINCLGKKFDPNFHEVVEDVPVESLAKAGVKDKESGIIIEEVQRGYKFQGKILRPAKVRVTK